MNARSVRPAAIATVMLALFYGGVVWAASGSFQHLVDQAVRDWYYLAMIMGGFGVQVALVSELRGADIVSSQRCRELTGSTFLYRVNHRVDGRRDFDPVRTRGDRPDRSRPPASPGVPHATGCWRGGTLDNDTTLRKIPHARSVVTPDAVSVHGVETAVVMIFRRALPAVMIAIVVLGIGAVPAFARDDGGSDSAGVLVRQAIAHLVHDPNNTMAAGEKIDAAINAVDTSGVDIALVTQAATALGQGNVHGARSLLERSIGARPHLGGSDPQPIREVPTFSVGAETGIDVVTDPLAPYRTLGGGDVAALAALVALGALGACLAMRFRPRRDAAL